MKQIGETLSGDIILVMSANEFDRIKELIANDDAFVKNTKEFKSTPADRVLTLAKVSSWSLVKGFYRGENDGSLDYLEKIVSGKVHIPYLGATSISKLRSGIEKYKLEVGQ